MNHTIPEGQFRGGALEPGTFHGQTIPEGVLHGGALEKGTFHYAGLCPPGLISDDDEEKSSKKRTDKRSRGQVNSTKRNSSNLKAKAKNSA